jgi:hypothetical protein
MAERFVNTVATIEAGTTHVNHDPQPIVAETPQPLPVAEQPVVAGQEIDDQEW